MSYQTERDTFVARMTQEGLPLDVTRKLLAAATTLQRYAELACSSEAADRDRVPCPALRNNARQPDRYPCLCDSARPYDLTSHDDVPRIAVLDHRLLARTRKLLPAGWMLDTRGDPRGYVLRVIPPSYAARNAGRDRFTLDTIGVPSRESRIRW